MIPRVQYIMLHFRRASWISHQKQGYLSALAWCPTFGLMESGRVRHFAQLCFFFPNVLTQLHFISFHQTTFEKRCLFKKKKKKSLRQGKIQYPFLFVFAQMYELSRWMHMLSVAPQTCLQANSTINTVFKKKNNVVLLLRSETLCVGRTAHKAPPPPHPAASYRHRLFFCLFVLQSNCPHVGSMTQRMHCDITYG